MKNEKNTADHGIIIRPMKEADISLIATVHCPPWSTIEETKEKWVKYFSEQQTALRTVGIVEQNSKVLGYGSLLLRSEYNYFARIPEIQDLWVFKEYRKNGVGSQLISWLEELAKSKGYKEIGIGVGLYKDYGSAQRLYIQLGYLPDGNGVTYKYKPTVPGEPYPLDDELILWLKKKL